MEISAIVLFNIFMGVSLAIAGIYFFMKGYRHLWFDKIADLETAKKEHISNFYLKQLRIVKKKFWISFYILEGLIILYFILGSILLLIK